MRSAQTQLDLVDQLRAEGLKRGIPSAQIEADLRRAGYIQDAQAGQQGGGGFMHGVGQVARGVPMGLAGLADIPGSAIAGLSGRPYQSYRGMIDQALPGAPQTPQDSLLASAGEGLGASLPFGAGGLAARAGMGALGAGAGAAAEGAKQAGVGPLGQMAASAAVGGFPLAKYALAGSIRYFLAGNETKRAAARATDALIQAGNPDAARTLGQSAEGGVARTMEGGLKNYPGSSSVIHKTLEKQATEMEGRVEKVASGLGRESPKEVVGARVVDAIKQGYIPNFKTKSGELYAAVDAMVPPKSPVTPTETMKLFMEQSDLKDMAGKLGNDVVPPKLYGILERLSQQAEAGDGTIPFGVIKALRTELGDMLDGTVIEPEMNLGRVKQIWSVLTQDMEAAVQASGGSPAMEAWKRATEFTKAGHEKIRTVLEPLVASNEPERVFNALMSGTKEGATFLHTSLGAMDDEAQGLVRSYVLRNMGRMGEGGEFNPEIFLRKLNKLAPTARAALFDGVEENGDNLAALAAVSEARKAQGKVMFNPAGTAQNVAFQGIMNGLTNLGTLGKAVLGGSAAAGAAGGAMAHPALVALGAAAGPALTAVAANQLAERVFTNPKMITWLLRQTKIPFGALNQELAILAKDAAKWGPEDRETALEFVKTMTDMDWRTIISGGAVADATAVRR